MDYISIFLLTIRCLHKTRSAAVTSMTSDSKGFNNLSFIGSNQIKANNTMMPGSQNLGVALDGNMMKQPLKRANTFPYQVLQNNDSTTSYSSSASADSDSYAEDTGTVTASGPSDTSGIVKNRKRSSPDTSRKFAERR